MRSRLCWWLGDGGVNVRLVTVSAGWFWAVAVVGLYEEDTTPPQKKLLPGLEVG